MFTFIRFASVVFVLVLAVATVLTLVAPELVNNAQGLEVLKGIAGL